MNEQVFESMLPSLLRSPMFPDLRQMSCSPGRGVLQPRVWDNDSP